MGGRRRRIDGPALCQRVASNLKRLLDERGMDERDFAVALGWTKTSEAHGASDVRKYLRGERWPREDTLALWARILDVDPVELLRAPE